MLVKSTPGVNFTNMCSFYVQLLSAQIPKEHKDTDNLTEFLRFIESTCVKATHKYVGEIDPRCA